MDSNNDDDIDIRHRFALDLDFALDREMLDHGVTAAGAVPIAWPALTAAAETRAGWAGVLTGARYVLQVHGADPRAMVGFFRSVTQDPLPPPWQTVAAAVTHAVDQPQTAVVDGVREFVTRSRATDLQSLVHLDRIRYCWETYGHDHDKLRRCITGESA